LELQKPSEPGPIERELLVKQFISVDQVHFNVSQAVIVTTEDKVELCLNRYVGQLEKRNAWIAPLGILITVGLTLTTTSFKDFLLPAQTWSALFSIAGLGSLVWLGVSLRAARKTIGVKEVIKEIKLGSSSVVPQGEETNAR
jgi:hypothetical protein